MLLKTAVKEVKQFAIKEAGYGQTNGTAEVVQAKICDKLYKDVGEDGVLVTFINCGVLALK